MKACVGAYLGAILLSGAASAQPAPPAAPVVGPCRTILDASERLRCYDEDANFDFGQIVLRELECDRPPKAAEVLKVLIRRNAVRSMAFHVADGFNYFELAKPEKIDGMTVVAVFGFDETGRFPFLRSGSASPGPVFGVVTRDSLPAVDRWRLRHSPGLMSDDTASNMKGAKDIACMRTTPAGGTPSAEAITPASQPGARADDLFEAGLAPKRR